MQTLTCQLQSPLATQPAANSLKNVTQAFYTHRRSLARTLLKRRYTAVTWQSAQPHPEWQY